MLRPPSNPRLPAPLPVRSWLTAGTVMVTARVTPAEHAAWQDKAAAAGVSPSSLLWQAMARTRTAPATVERERTRQVAGAVSAKSRNETYR